MVGCLLAAKLDSSAITADELWDLYVKVSVIVFLKTNVKLHCM